MLDEVSARVARGKIHVTFFANAAATTAIAEQLTLAELRRRILWTTAPSKAELPWLKLATFGNKRSAVGSLRHNANVLSISGVETDYDGEKRAFHTAVAILKTARIYSLVYTSPSHTQDAPRWRILAPTSKPLPPRARAKMVARLNGLFAGVLAPESFTLSRGFYYGRVENNSAHRAEIIDGDCIDERADLDAGAIGDKHATSTRKRKPNQKLIADNINMVVAAVAAIPNDFEGWMQWKHFGMAVWGATGGEGFDIFDEFSQRWECGGYDAANTQFCWEEICRSPPNNIGAGTIFHTANLASPAWRKIYEQKLWQEICAKLRRR